MTTEKTLHSFARKDIAKFLKNMGSLRTAQCNIDELFDKYELSENQRQDVYREVQKTFDN